MNVQGENISAPAPRRLMLTDVPPGPPVFPPPPRRRRSGLIPLTLACLSVGIGAAALIVAISGAGDGAGGRVTAAPAAPTYTADQIAVAETKTCGAAKRAIEDLRINTNRGSAPATLDDALGWANVALARAARLSAAVYLPTQVDPATPGDLKAAVNTFATAAGDTLAYSLSMDPRNHMQYIKANDTLNAMSVKIEGLCG